MRRVELTFGRKDHSAWGSSLWPVWVFALLGALGGIAYGNNHNHSIQNNGVACAIGFYHGYNKCVVFHGWEWSVLILVGAALGASIGWILRNITLKIRYSNDRAGGLQRSSLGGSLISFNSESDQARFYKKERCVSDV